MKKFIERFYMKKYTLIYIYAAVFLIYILNGAFNMVYAVLFKPQEEHLQPKDFELVNMEIISDNTVIAVSDDPQIIYNSTNGNIYSIYYELETSAVGVVSAYYATNFADDFSSLKRLAPPFGESRDVFYVMPDKDTVKIRLDLGSLHGQTYTFTNLTINKDIPLWRHFALTNRQVIILLSVPLLLNATIWFAVQIINNYKAIKRREN